MQNDTVASVICITYNHENYVAGAIEGIIGQKTQFPFEIVVADDASTDNNPAIIEKYASEYPDLVRPILRKENVGGNANWIDALGKCRGRYVALCDGDDFWTDPFKLQKQVDFLEANPQHPLCFTNSLVVDGGGKILKTDRIPAGMKRNLSQSEIISGYCPPSNTLVFRNGLIKKFPERFTEIDNGDFLLYILLTEFGEAAYLDFVSAAYRLHSGGTWSSRSNESRAKSYLKTIQALLDLYGDRYGDVLTANMETCLNELAADTGDEPAPLTLKIEEPIRQKDPARFTENGFWTPQTRMLQAIDDWIGAVDFNPASALSIDQNPTLDQILLGRWPSLKITRAAYPAYDAQNLSMFSDGTYDIVYSHQVLEHVPKPWIAAGEIVRVLKRGGIGIHTTCAFNPRHGLPEFNDYYRFLPDGLAELFEGVKILVKEEWGSRQAILYNVGIDDGHGLLGGRRFPKKVGEESDGLYPWHTWVIFQKQ